MFSNKIQLQHKLLLFGVDLSAAVWTVDVNWLCPEFCLSRQNCTVRENIRQESAMWSSHFVFSVLPVYSAWRCNWLAKDINTVQRSTARNTLNTTRGEWKIQAEGQNLCRQRHHHTLTGVRSDDEKDYYSKSSMVYFFFFKKENNIYSILNDYLLCSTLQHSTQL